MTGFRGQAREINGFGHARLCNGAVLGLLHFDGVEYLDDCHAAMRVLEGLCADDDSVILDDFSDVDFCSGFVRPNKDVLVWKAVGGSVDT